MLAELDMLKEPTKGDDEDLRSLDGHGTIDSSELFNHSDVKLKYPIENIPYGDESPIFDNSTLTATICQIGSDCTEGSYFLEAKRYIFFCFWVFRCC